VGYQVVLRRLPSDLHHDVFTKTLCLEDVLVSAVFGALAYGPPAMFAAWLRLYTTMPRSSSEMRPEFWPSNMRAGRLQREPDVFLRDQVRNRALVVEAKRGSMPKPEVLAQQLVEEGQVARATHPGVQLHLLVVSDKRSAQEAFEQVRSRRPRLYGARMCEATWIELVEFLGGWMSRPECDAGHRRMIGDALNVMAKYGVG